MFEVMSFFMFSGQKAENFFADNGYRPRYLKASIVEGKVDFPANNSMTTLCFAVLPLLQSP